MKIIRWKRQAHGNMVFMCVAIGALILVVVGVAFWFYLQFFSNQMLQNTSETVALSAAQKLNDNNYTGKINNLIGGSRELVFSSRKMLEKTENDGTLSEFGPLAAQVLEESRLGSLLVARERDRYANLTVSQLRQMLKDQKCQFGKEMALFDAAVDTPKVIDVSVGTLDNMESNVAVSTGIPDLVAYDNSQHFLRHGKETDFYRSTISLRLPGPDSDLNFQLSPLPIAVNGTTAPLRLVTSDHFRTTFTLRKNGEDTIGGCNLIPSCVQVLMNVTMKSKVASDVKSGTMTLSTACTTGATPEPK